MFFAVPAGTRRPSLSRRLALALIGCFAGLVLAESLARVLAALRSGNVAAYWQSLRDGAPPRRLDGPAALGDLVRASDDPQIVYELIPGLVAEFQGVRCRINRQGGRGPDWPAPARTNALRIVGLGDSVTFGWGVDEDDTFLAVLARELAAELRRPVEVLNTGVPGYNTAMEVAAFERRALAWRPDVVLVDWVGNDADLPNFIAQQTDALDLGRCFLYDLARRVAGRHSRWADAPLQGAPWAGDRFESDPDRVPPAYRDMVGEPGVVRALERLARLAHERGFQVALTTHVDVPVFVQRTCDRLGIPCVPSGPRLRDWLTARGLAARDYLASDLVLSRDDPHPSRIGHALHAGTIRAFLVASGWCRVAEGVRPAER